MTNSRSAVLNGRRIGSQRPRLVHLPDGAVSAEAGRDACEFAESVGLVLDDWQRWCVEQILSERVDGTPAAKQTCLIVPRQNGKGSILEAVELYGLYVQGLKRQVHSAHLADTAAEHMARLRSIIEDDPELASITAITVANGKEKITNRETGGQIVFSTRTKGSKRGTSPQRIVLDEALFLADEHLQAMVPAMAAQSLDPETMPQVIVTSSAPLPESTVLHRLRRAGLAGLIPSQFFAEWSVPLGSDPFDRDNWYTANPGQGIRIAEDFVAEVELPPLMTLDAFCVERLGMVADDDDAAGELPGWGACLDPGSRREGVASFSVDVTPDLSWTSIGAAGSRADGLTHVEFVERVQGTGPSVNLLVALWRKHGRPIHLDPRSPAGGLVTALRAEGVEVVEVGGLELSKSCAAFKSAVANGQVRHIGQAALDAAVAGAAVRAVGDGWAWARRSSHVDISPLVAVTLAFAASVVGKPLLFSF